MKNVSLIAIVMFVISIVACKSGADNAILRKWQITEFDSPGFNKMLKEQEASIDTMKVDSMKQMMKEEFNKMKSEFTSAMLKTTMEFKNDGKYVSDGGPKSETGSWKMESDGKQLLTTSENGKTDTFEVVSLTPEALKLKLGNGDDAVSLTMKPVEVKK